MLLSSAKFRNAFFSPLVMFGLDDEVKCNILLKFMNLKQLQPVMAQWWLAFSLRGFTELI